MTIGTPPLTAFVIPVNGPATVEKACYDSPSKTLFIIGADGQLYTYAGVPASAALNLLQGPAHGMFASLIETKWPFTVGSAPTS